jgi:hypothetical protein
MSEDYWLQLREPILIIGLGGEKGEKHSYLQFIASSVISIASIGLCSFYLAKSSISLWNDTKSGVVRIPNVNWS